MRLEVPSLLITDDDRDFRETLRSVFEPRFRTLLASDGQQALDILHEQEVHLLLLDMHDENLIRQAQLAEAFSVLSKPITRQQITSSVNAAMRRIYNWEAE